MVNNAFDLAKKVVLITGASSGIGRAVAVESSKMGATVIITGRNEERLNETYHSLTGHNHKMIRADLTKQDEVERLVESLPVLDGMVNAAGIVNALPFRFMSREKLDDIMQVNFYAPALFTQLAIRNRRLADQGSIIFISSLSGTRRAVLGNSAYSASKSAICGLAKNMALELAPKKIRVNTILPGMIETGILAKSPVSDDDFKKNMLRYPLQRYGRPEEVAWLCIYLLSDASAWMTGSELLLDGGFTL